MFDQEKTVESAKERAELAAWERPQVRRMEAGMAEIGGGIGADALVTLS
jgi:hypothetical protein